MSCKLCSKKSYGDTCGYCINLISVEIERFNKSRHMGVMGLTSAYLHMLCTFETHVAQKGPSNELVGWDLIDALTKRCIRHA